MIKKKGSLLLEINMFLFLFAILFSGFFQGTIHLWENVDKVKDHIFMGRVARDLLAIMEYQLTFHTTEAVVQENSGNSILHCTTLGQAKKRSFFCQKYPQSSNLGFYQKIQVLGRNPGVNPLSPPDMGVTDFHVEKLSSFMVKVDFTLTVLATGRHKNFTGVLYLRNGTLL